MTTTAIYKGVEVSADVAACIRYMGQVDEYREALQKLQAVWDNLALLGQLSGAGIDIGETRAGFEGLSTRLLGSLAAELRRKTQIDIRFRAQVAIDILVRNLFERTADIGFLAMDTDLAEFCEQGEGAGGGASRDRIVARMQEYVRKYSVYHDVILLSPEGRVLARLDERADVTDSQDPLIAQALQAQAPYIEVYGPTDLAPGAGPQLIYAYRVMAVDGSRPVGVLCLCFRLQNECERIFANLRRPGDWTLIALVDAQGCVVASSDTHHVPPGARFEFTPGEGERLFRFGGRAYIAATRETVGYQGYGGPGWRGHAMVPVEHAFDADEAAVSAGLDAAVLSELLASEQLFPQTLREIPALADSIRSNLTRAVWNGNIRQGKAAGAGNHVFSKALLWEIGRVGGRTRDVFARSIRHLNETVVSSMLDDCGAQAALAIDIMDRNLYERANDCRWWALTSLFRATLSQPEVSAADGERMCAVLDAINRLYTVYTDLLLFDRSGRVVAVSNAASRGLVGRALDDEWVAHTLRLRDTQQYAVSTFAPTPLYADRSTYVYCAAVRDVRGQGNVGGVAIVFDSEPQFEAMLSDALPRDQGGAVREGCLGLFVQRDGRIVASTDRRYPVGDRFELHERVRALAAGEQVSMIVRLDGALWALGARMSSGYREYKSSADEYRNDIVALILVPLTAACGEAVRAPAVTDEATQRWSWPQAAGDEERIEVATFYIGGNWYGLPSTAVESAIEADRLIRMPGAAALGGMILYGDEAIPVYDLPELRGAFTAQGGTRQIVVLRPAAGGAPFGLLVDQLGDIPELPSSAVRPVQMLSERVADLLDGLVTPIAREPGANVPMLLLVSVERLRARVQGRQVPSVVALAS